MAPARVVPLYHQIYLTLKNDLIAGHYPADQPFPNEIELAKRFKVARMTLRRTLSQLQDEGLIVRKAGIGTFPKAVERSVKFRNSLDSFYDYNAALLKDPRYEMRRLGSIRMPTPEHIRRDVAGFDTDCIRASTLFKLKGKPLHFGLRYVPIRLSDDTKRADAAGEALPNFLRRVGRGSVRTDIAISAVAADMTAAKHLQVPVGAPLIAARHIAYAADDTAIEFVEALSPPDRFEFVFRFTDGGNGRT